MGMSSRSPGRLPPAGRPWRGSPARLGGLVLTTALLALPTACGGPGPGATASTGPDASVGSAPIADAGDFGLTYQPAENRNLAGLIDPIREAAVIEPEIDWLNQAFALPRDVTVVWLECGEDNAFYDTETTTIELCYEMVDDFVDRFEADGDDPEDAFWYAMDAAAFFFHHEVGHALVDLYALPITGREEDASDELAAITLIEGWEDGALTLMAAMDSFYLSGMEEEASGDAEDLPFWDEHAFDLQRFYRIACLIYGSDAEEEAWLVEDGSVPEEQAEACVDEYAQKRESWSRLLEPYYLETPAP